MNQDVVATEQADDGEWGWYTVLSVGDWIRNERTNVGVIVYGADGVQRGARIDSRDRWLRREPEQAPAADFIWEEVAGCVANLRTVDDLVAYREQGRSYTVQCREHYGTRLDTGEVDRLFERFVSDDYWRKVYEREDEGDG